MWKKWRIASIAIVSHYDCAGNPADKETQLSHILASNNTVKSWEFDARVIGLWVAENGDVAVIAK
ncbi:MAG: carbonic anhydrase [bacterium]